MHGANHPTATRLEKTHPLCPIFLVDAERWVVKRGLVSDDMLLPLNGL
jgi:hypothetical protein